MIRWAPDASTLRSAGSSIALVDVQWLTPHLASLGAGEMGRERYLERLRDAIAQPSPEAFGG